MKKFASVALLTLAACAGPAPIVRPVSVPVPQVVLCHPPLVVPPPWPTHQLPQQADLFEKTRALLVELDLRQAYEAELQASVHACQ